MFDPQAFLKFLLALLAMLNPLAAIPFFITLTESQTAAQRKRTALICAGAVLLTLLLMAAVGQEILSVFGITIGAFRVTGGLVLLLIAFSMLNAQPHRFKHTKEEAAQDPDQGNVAIVPLAIPLLVGPGSISLVIVTIHQFNDWQGFLMVICAAVLAAALVWITLRFALPLEALLGQTGLNIVTRLMGIILAAIAIELIATGLLELLPGLGKKP
jgi:multiple antibiotic resistance protein